MLLNEFQLNDQQINGDLGYVEGLLLQIEKTITFQASQVSQTLITIEKNIVTEASSFTLIYISKIIADAAAPANTFYNRNGWEPLITVGGLLLTSSNMTGGIKVSKGEGDNTTASFTIILRPNTYDLYAYQGKDVTIKVKTNAGVNTIFTGKVDVPVVDVIEEKLTLNCVADRRVLISRLGSAEPYIGYYSATVLGDNPDITQRINARLDTVPASLDFDSFNRYSIVTWTAQDVPNFSYGSNDVYRRDPQMSIDSSGQIINKVSVTISYNYQRHHSVTATFNWNHLYDTISGGTEWCPLFFDTPSMPSKSMINSAAQSAGWLIYPGSMTFTDQPPAGIYDCGLIISWGTGTTQSTNQALKNPDGTDKVDASGNKLSTSVAQSSNDPGSGLALAASWSGIKQFSQNVTETYTLSVQSPESINRYGEIAAEDSFSYEGIDRFSEWETDTRVNSQPSGVPIVGDANSYYFNSDQDRNVFNNAVFCALNRAKTIILKTHRNTRVTFQRALTPTIELKHTVALTGKWVRGKGKCSAITHYLNISDGQGGTAGEAYTEITFLQFRGNTTVTNSALVPPTKPTDGYSPPVYSVRLGNHLGEDPSQFGAETWNGYVGNVLKYYNTGGTGTRRLRTTFEESFIVDTPDISPQAREDRELSNSGTYNIDIPNDDIEYESYG